MTPIQSAYEVGFDGAFSTVKTHLFYFYRFVFIKPKPDDGR